MAKISTQASNTLVVLERLGRMAYKRVNTDDKKPFDDTWKCFKTNGRINPLKLFFKADKVQNFKLNLCEGTAKMMLGIIAYIAYCVENEEYESLRVEQNRIYINMKYPDFESLTFDVFLHRDKLNLSILAEPAVER